MALRRRPTIGPVRLQEGPWGHQGKAKIQDQQQSAAPKGTIM